MKTPEQVRVDIERRWARTWAQDVTAEADAPHADPGAAPVETNWPHAFPLGRLASSALAGSFGTFLEELSQLRTWAGAHQVELTWQERRVAGTSQQAPTQVCVASLDAAAAILGVEHTTLLATARARAAVLAERYRHALTPKTLTAVTRLSEVDFDLLCRAADWFTTRTGAGLTPRQVPVEGLHAKWLNARQALVAELAGRADLELLPPHPARVHFTYLDPEHRARGGRWHDSATVGDRARPAYLPRVVIISENKDTAIHFPPVPGGISVEGVGKGGAAVAAIPWIREAEHLFYWGDMDADGLEILDGFRAAGLAAQSLLMDLPTYEQWCRFGTNLDPKGQPLRGRPQAPLSHLDPAERALYAQLCDDAFTGVRRVEQERIPLPVAAAAVEARTQDLIHGT